MIIVIAAAFFVDMVIGDPYWLPHPICFIGWLIHRCEMLIRGFTEKVNGIKKVMAERIGGILLVCVTVLVVFFLVIVLLHLANRIDQWILMGTGVLGLIVHTYFIFSCLATKCLAIETKKVYYALIENDLTEARKYLSYLVGRETSQLSEQEIIRAAVETVAENTVDGVIAPLFYAFLGGAPLAFVYKAINTMDSMVGYMNEKYLHFGWAAAKIDDLANYIPARITGVLMPAASSILGYNMGRSYRIMWRDRRNHKSPNCAYPEAATAGALGVRLGGTNVYFGKKVYKPTIGDESRPLEAEDIIRTIWIMYMTSIVSLIVFSVLYFVILRGVLWM